jgi:Fur family ferric uptake transcriptional regulator
MNNQYFKDLLHKRELKATSPRLNLLAIMQEYQTAMPFAAIQAAMKATDRVTLYRTMESLKEQGIIHTAFKDNNESYYALCGQTCNKKHHHHDHIHLKCVKCNSVTCQKPNKAIEIAIDNVEIYKVSVNIEGLCTGCFNK